MGSIFVSSTGLLEPLVPSTMVGRASEAQIQVKGREEVSRDQLRLRWEKAGWTLQPMSIIAGTFLNGRRLKPTDRVLLREGDEIGLSRPAPDLILRTLEPPLLVACDRQDGKKLVVPRSGQELPEGRLFCALGRGWVIERNGQQEDIPLEELLGGRYVLGGWELHLPETESATKPSIPSLDDLVLILTYPRNMEVVRMVLRADGWEADLGYRAEFYPLLVLAKERIDSANGWMDAETLARQARPYEWNTIDAYLGRASKMVARLGVLYGKELIESRRKERRIAIPGPRIRLEEEA